MRTKVVSGLLAAGLAALLLPAMALAAPPTRSVTDLDDPVFDTDESGWASAMCGFPITAEVAGHIISTTFATGRRSVQSLDIYGIRETFTNPANGASVQLRDIGPDRFYVKDGKAYVAVTGRSVTGSG